MIVYMQAQVIFVLIELEQHCLHSWLQTNTANSQYPWFCNPCEL